MQDETTAAPKKKMSGTEYKKMREAKKRGSFTPTIVKHFAFSGDCIVIEVQEFADENAYRWRMVVNGNASDVYDSPVRAGATGSIYHEGYISQTESMEGFDIKTGAVAPVEVFTPFRILACHPVNASVVMEKPHEAQNDTSFTEKGQQQAAE
jgi:hypothetical protein